MTKSKVSKLGVVLLEDWMVKSPPFAKIHQIKSWHRRYFALLQINHGKTYTVPRNWSKKGPKSLENLHDVYLVYWEKKGDRKKGAKPIRTIPLLKGYSVHAQQPPFFESKFHHVLLLNTIERKFYLCAESEDMKKRWLDTLSQVIKTRDESCIAKDGDAITEPIYEVIRDILKGSINSIDSPPQSESSSRISSCSSISELTSADYRRPSTTSSLMSSPASDSTNSDEDGVSVYEKMHASPDPSLDKIQLKTRSLPVRNKPRPYSAYSADDNIKKFKCPGNKISFDAEHIEETSPQLNFSEPLYRQLEPEDFNQNINCSPSKSSMITVNKDSRTIVFFDFKLEVPHSSSIAFSDNCLTVRTSHCQCVFTMTKQKEEQKEMKKSEKDKEINEKEKREEENRKKVCSSQPVCETMESTTTTCL